MKRTPLKTYVRIERRTPLRSRGIAKAEAGGRAAGGLGRSKIALRASAPTRRRGKSASPSTSAPPAFPKPEHVAGSSHKRRKRELGRMAWLHSLKLCFVATSDFGPNEQRPGPCDGEFQVMHLGARKGYRAPDCQTALGCRGHHEDIDQARTWFAALSVTERAAFEKHLYDRATAAWMWLTPEQRAAWDELAARERAERRAA